MKDRNLSIRVVRRNCLECSDGSAKAVVWCPCNGVASTRCEFWPYRFGLQPGTIRQKYGDRLLTPALMPSADVDLDLLPRAMVEASSELIDVPGYRVEAVELPQKRVLTAEERARLGEQLGWGSKQPRDGDSERPGAVQNSTEPELVF